MTRRSFKGNYLLYFLWIMYVKVVHVCFCLFKLLARPLQQPALSCIVNKKQIQPDDYHFYIRHCCFLFIPKFSLIYIISPNRDME